MGDMNDCAEMCVEFTTFDADGSRSVVRLKCRATPATEALLGIVNQFDEDDLSKAWRTLVPTDLHDVKIEFTNCKIVDPE